MTTAEWITASVVFIIAAILAVVSIRSFLNKGFLFNNAYIYASKEERGKIDKKPYYRQSAIVFCILSAVFLIIGLSLLLHKDKLFLLEIPLIVGVIIYAIVSTVDMFLSGIGRTGMRYVSVISFLRATWRRWFCCPRNKRSQV